jgi:hypothetical protein
VAKLPPFLKPRLRLFLGADIVGSTALKQTRAGTKSPPTDQATKGPSWFPTIQGFYFEASQAFLLDWELAKAASTDPINLFGQPPRVWKTIGDEVLFVKDITDHRQIVITIQVWIGAIRRMKEFLRAEHSTLDVKSACWTAGFPFRNREVVLDPSPSLNRGKVEDYYKESGKLLNSYYSNKKKPNIVIDYIGPSIDIGFRLSSHSNSRKMMVSVDVAYLISMTQVDGEIKRIDFFYDGSTALKGVLGGSNYPLFWIDMSSDESLARFEDKLKKQNVVPKEDVKEYCDAFYKEHAAFTFRPFIDGDLGQTLTKTPPWYEEYQNLLAENFYRPESAYASDIKGEAAKSGDDVDDDSVEKLVAELKAQMRDDGPDLIE